MRRKKGALLNEKDLKALKTTRGKRGTGIFMMLFCFIVLISVISNRGSGVDYSGITWIGLIVGALGLLLFLSTFPLFKGWIGERKVASRLKVLARKYNGYLINDVTIPDEETGRTSQIDHILFTCYGIFVVETKNYSGYIYGNDSQSDWTQVLNYGRVKNRLYNPVKQNAVHCYRLSAIINNEKLHLASVVVFVKDNGGDIQSASVYNLDDLRYLIQRKSAPIYDEEDVRKAYETIYYYKENKVISKKEHVQTIRENKTKIQQGICPRCGGQLVVRYSKDGNQFYGCSNYPECTFTKRISK